MELTITRALSEKKMVEKRLNDKILNGTFVGIVKGNAEKPISSAFKTKEELAETIQSSYDSVSALIDRYKELASAIIRSNSSTLIKIDGVEMTVSEALERKKSIAHETGMLKRLREDYARVTRDVNDSNANMQYSIDQQVKAMMSGDRSIKSEEESINLVTQAFSATTEQHIFDPAGIVKRIEEYVNIVEGFNNEIDYALSESNAKTLITIKD